MDFKKVLYVLNFILINIFFKSIKIIILILSIYQLFSFNFQASIFWRKNYVYSWGLFTYKLVDTGLLVNFNFKLSILPSSYNSSSINVILSSISF